jgi:Fe(3+) dicitrate transport protein
MGKFRVNSSRGAPRYQELEVKVGWQDQTAHETYLGLSEGDFRRNPLMRYAASGQDVLNTDHNQAVARYFLQASRRTDLVVTGYRNVFARNWYKLQSVQGQGISGVIQNPDASPDAFAILQGASSEDDALVVRANNRTYESRGIQAVLGFRTGGGGTAHNVEMGVRFHQDHEDRLQWEDGYRMTPGGMVLTSEGVPGSQDNRRGEAEALALFIQDEIRVGRWSFVPGLRWEHIDFTRSDWERSDGERRQAPQLRENSVSTFIPGLGVTWEWSPRTHLFGGVHKGFGPPGPGADQDTRVEESRNYELGLRTRRAVVGADVTAFVSDYDNILGAATLATGEAGTGDLFNGGAVHTYGMEMASDVELGRLLDLPVRVPLRASYAFTRGEFRSSFTSAYGPWGQVERGDRLPYLPEHTWSGSLGLEEGAWDLSLEWSGASAMRTEAGRGAIRDGEGADRYHVFHLNAARDLGAMGTVYGGVQNLGDERYVVSRRPAGARPGLPRTFFLGFRVAR